MLNRPLGEKLALYSNAQLQRLTGVEAVIHDLSAEISNLFFQGGPVEPGYLFFLHRLESLIEQGVQICPGIILGGDLDTIRAEAAVLETANPVLRFYLGYAGWQAGQLEAEIEIGAWYLCPSSAELVFDTPPDDLWQQTLYSLGGKYRILSFIPEDPSVN